MTDSLSEKNYFYRNSLQKEYYYDKIKKDNRLPVVNLLIIVTHVHLKQNENGNPILVCYFPPRDIF